MKRSTSICARPGCGRPVPQGRLKYCGADCMTAPGLQARNGRQYLRLWGDYVREVRKRRKLTRNALARAADVDGSYVTLIERNGRVPDVEVVCALARALGADEDRTMVVAGYAPRGVAWAELWERLALRRAQRQVKALDPDLRAVWADLLSLPPGARERAKTMLRALVDTVRGRRKP